jgi:hypothetical protein
MVTQLPLLQLSTRQQIAVGVCINYVSNNPQAVLLLFAVPFSNYTQQRLNNWKGLAPSYVT